MKFSAPFFKKHWPYMLILSIPLWVSYDKNPAEYNESIVTVTLPPAEVDWARFYGDRFSIGKDLALKIMFAADRVGLSREVAFNLVRVESSFNPYAVSNAGAVGLTQVLPTTAEIYGVSRAKLFHTETNLYVGFSYLMRLYERFGDMKLALAAYNAGPTRIARIIAMGAYVPSAYTQKVLGD